MRKYYSKVKLNDIRHKCIGTVNTDIPHSPLTVKQSTDSPVPDSPHRKKHYTANQKWYNIEKFFGFLQQLCLKLGFKLIIISHDERILPYSNKFFYVNGGNIYEGQEGVDKFLIEKKEGGTVQ